MRKKWGGSGGGSSGRVNSG